jgi:hypothetical protein
MLLFLASFGLELAKSAVFAFYFNPFGCNYYLVLVFFLVEEKDLNELRKARRREFLARSSAKNVSHVSPSAKRNLVREEEKDLKRKDNISPKGLYV